MSKIIEIFAKSIFIKPRLNLLEWAERYRFLSKESSSSFGKFKAFSYQCEPMIEISNPKREKVILLWASQLGKSELINNVLGYYIHQEPSTILFMLPNKDDAEDYSKRRLAPMFRDTHELSELINANDANNTILIKNFRGGNLALVGSNSPSKLASKPIKVLLVDEADRCEATKEGDSIELAQRRTATFYDRKIVISSTPTISGASTIEKEFINSDQRLFFVKCPFCQHEQKLIFERIIYELDEHKELINESVKYQCSECGSLLSEQDKNEAVKNGRWIAQNPKSKIAGFFLNAIYSPFYKMSEIVKTYLDAKGDELKIQTFKNTIEALAYEPPNTSFNENELLNRVEEYDDQNLSQNISFVTAGVDIQGNRVEVIFIGWCKGYEAYNIDYKQIYGNTDQDEVWQKLFRELKRKFKDLSDCSGELFSILEFNDYLRELIKSSIADISNCASSRYGGAITAGLFLDKFIKDEYKDKWLHLDIAGPAYLEKAWGYYAAGATGAGVRANLYFLQALAKELKDA